MLNPEWASVRLGVRVTRVSKKKAKDIINIIP